MLLIADAGPLKSRVFTLHRSSNGVSSAVRVHVMIFWVLTPFNPYLVTSVLE